MIKYLILTLGVCLCWSSATLAWAKADQESLSVAQAEYQKGSDYYYGQGVEKDVEKALSWYLKSAKKRHAKSELAVSQVLSFGDLKNRRFTEALPWLIKAEGPHEAPQISGMEAAHAIAKKNLRWMCKKGLVDFPQSHPYANDPICWLKRGDRLLHGSSLINYYAMKDKKKYYGVEKDYVASRLYLEKAFAAGEMEAAIHLATIYQKGLGIPKDMEKFEYYTEFASIEGHGESNYYLAESALEGGDSSEYIEKLKSSAQDGYWKATKELAWAYFTGDNVETDKETAFMYFFLRGQSSFVRGNGHRGDLRFPFSENRFLPTFQTEISLETLETSHKNALKFAGDYNFRSHQIKEIDRSYNIAVSDFHYVMETGGEWHKSDIGSRLTFYLLFFIAILVFRSIAETIVDRS